MGERLVIGHASALRYWREERSHAARMRDDTPTVSVVSGVRQGEGKAGHGELARLVRRGLALTGGVAPLHTIAGKPIRRRKSANLESHLWSVPLERMAVRRVDTDLYVCDAASAFVQMARSASVVDLALIAFELCGLYVIDESSEHGLIPTSSPLLELGELYEAVAVARACGCSGTAKAQQALTITQEGSRSPAESKVAIMMGSGRLQGGYGLDGFVLNQKIALTGRAREIWGLHKITPDFLWPEERLVLEYESDDFHANKHQVNRDSRRQNAYIEAGYRPRRLTSEQTHDIAVLDAVMEDIAKDLGRYRKAPSTRMLLRRGDLHKRLFLTNIDPLVP